MESNMNMHTNLTPSSCMLRSLGQRVKTASLKAAGES
jgi:hypothetical protein